ncbi:uncharacterized protein FA14DRAFT_162096 [Meira miltonrushii]|uniref:Vacuolar membrane-associated protein IML1 n=1 Tax=Meira miltonrushii TaxID=1280837 RepID=A0A316V5I7_9BASI|nr:uncharacterized protein FA14DRAFT_162096 [Meira miltonrushii]PWN32837.1 hypothetical protein FA14DRAFT_162096 [Meira miltonrushii]
MNSHIPSGSSMPPHNSRLDQFSLNLPNSHSRSPYRNSIAERRRSSSRRTDTSSSSLNRPVLTSRPVLLWTHEPPNFSTHELVLNPDLIAAFGGVSDGSELLEVRLPETSSMGNPVIDEQSTTGTGHLHQSHGRRSSNRHGSNHRQLSKRRMAGLSKRTFLFKASQAVGDLDCIDRSGSQLQLSIAKNIANIFHLHNRCEVILSKVSRSEHTISHIELYFRDQYVGRADMWRLVTLLEDTCVYVGQRVTLAGCVRATIGRIFINERKVMSGYVGPQTRAIFRSESAKYNVFIQMASEMWDFDEDGELYYEKALSGFLPDLIRRWQTGNTTHVISIILFARVHYDESELHMLQEVELPLRKEEGGKGRWYIDYYKVMVDLESDCDWQTALTMLKEEFFRFRHDILLLRQPVSGPAVAPWLEERHADLLRTDHALLAGSLSASHEGNILEAINLALNPFDEHYVDRDLNRTGLDLVVLTAGTGHFDVDKNLLRLTTERLIDNGIGFDLVCLTKMPLHSVPLFHFQSPVPMPDLSNTQATFASASGSTSTKRRSMRNSTANGSIGRSHNATTGAQASYPDPLYFDPKHGSPSKQQTQPQQVSASYTSATGVIRPSPLTDFYSIPHWVDCSFYNLQQDKPFRGDRFVPRCKMHEVQMLGLMENEISDISLPYIDFGRLPGVVAMSTSLGRSGSMSSSQAALTPFSSSASARHNRLYAFLPDTFGDTTGMNPREQHRLLREQFDKETFRDLELVPSTFRSLMVQGVSEKNLAGQIQSSSPPLVRQTLPSANSSSIRPGSSQQPIGRKENLTGSSPISQQQTPSKQQRSARSLRDSRFTLRSLESRDERLDTHEEEENSSTAQTKDAWNRQNEPASPRQKRISILPNISRSGTMNSSTSGSTLMTDSYGHENGLAEKMERRKSSAGSVYSVSTINRGLRPLSDMGKAKALVGSTEVTFKVEPGRSNVKAGKAAESAQRAVGAEQGGSRTPNSPSSPNSPSKTKGGYSWLWSAFKGKLGVPLGQEGDEDNEKVYDDKSEEQQSSKNASKKIQALLKEQSSARVSSTSRPASVVSDDVDDPKQSERNTIDDEAGPAPISIPSHHGATEGLKSKTSFPDIVTTTRIIDADGQPIVDDQDAALEQALEEEEARLRYVSQAQVEKQTLVNPCNPRKSLQATSNNQIMRWQHAFPRRLNQHVVKWRSMTTPACLPLTTFYLPSEADFKEHWQEYPYQMSISSDMTSFLVKRSTSTPPALAVMREMASQRLAQGYQFIVPIKHTGNTHTSASAMPDNLRLREPWELFQPGSLASGNPIFLSMTNQIHRIHYDRSSNCIHVKRYVRRVEYKTDPLTYSCCVWARNLAGYQTVNSVFRYPDFGAYNWTHLDAVIAGHSDEESFTESTRYWRTRFVVVPSEGSPQTLRGPSGEELSDEEVRLAGMDRLADLFNRARWRPRNNNLNGKRTGQREQARPQSNSTLLRFIPTSLDPAVSLKDVDFMNQIRAVHDAEKKEYESRKQGQGTKGRIRRPLAETDKATLVHDMYSDNEFGLKINDRLWNKILYRNAFSGHDFVTWLCQEYIDIPSRDAAVEWGQRLLKEGFLQHVHDYHGFLDGHYFYRIATEYAKMAKAEEGTTARDNQHWLTPGKESEDENGDDEKARRDRSKRVLMSRSIIIDVDPSRRSDRAEVAFLHFDLTHNPANGFNFQIHWLGSTARFIEDLVQGWTRAVERYGLRLIEAPINQIKDVSMHNPFQAPLPISLALHPPPTSVYAGWLPQHLSATYLFEYALLRKFGFILDQEASDRYRNVNKDVTIEYRSRPNHFDFSQFVHRSGVAFVQVLPNNEGFLWLDNRLFNSHLPADRPQHVQQHKGGIPPSPNLGAGPSHTHRTNGSHAANSPSLPSADRVRKEFIEFCLDVERLELFYKEVLEQIQAEAIAAKGTKEAVGNAPGIDKAKKESS